MERNAMLQADEECHEWRELAAIQDELEEADHRAQQEDARRAKMRADRQAWRESRRLRGLPRNSRQIGTSWWRSWWRQSHWDDNKWSSSAWGSGQWTETEGEHDHAAEEKPAEDEEEDAPATVSKSGPTPKRRPGIRALERRATTTTSSALDFLHEAAAKKEGGEDEEDRRVERESWLG